MSPEAEAFMAAVDRVRTSQLTLDDEARGWLQQIAGQLIAGTYETIFDDARDHIKKVLTDHIYRALQANAHNLESAVTGFLEAARAGIARRRIEDHPDLQARVDGMAAACERENVTEYEAELITMCLTRGIEDGMPLEVISMIASMMVGCRVTFFEKPSEGGPIFAPSTPTLH